MAKKTDHILSDIVPAPARGRDILVSRFSAMGDVAMTLPPLYDACLSNPDRRFIMLTRQHPASIFINPPENLVIHPIDTADYPGVAGMRRLYRELRDKYDIGAYADLHDVLRTQMLRLFFRLGGVKVTKVDKGRLDRYRLTRSSNKHLVELTPMSQRYAATLAAAGARGQGRFKSVFPTLPDPEIFANAILPRREGEKWIAIAPFARHPGKVYPERYMVLALAHMMNKIYGCRLILFGFGPEEEATIEKWRDILSSEFPFKPESIVNMASARIGLPAEMALIAHCDVMLSMDSANMHLATLVGTRVVSIWGATHPYCGFRPAALRDSDIIQLDMTCRPCSVFGNRPCMQGDYYCLKGIAPERVAEVVRDACNDDA